METTVEIVGEEMIVDYEIKITAHGYPATGPSYSSGGEPGAGPEFEVTVHAIRFPKQAADVVTVLPDWLKQLIETHLMERDDIGMVACDIDDDPDYGRDPDHDRDIYLENREMEQRYSHEFDRDD